MLWDIDVGVMLFFSLFIICIVIILSCIIARLIVWRFVILTLTSVTSRLDVVAVYIHTRDWQRNGGARGGCGVDAHVCLNVGNFKENSKNTGKQLR